MNRAVNLLAVLGLGLGVVGAACGDDEVAEQTILSTTTVETPTTTVQTPTTSESASYTWATTPPDTASSSICSNPPVTVEALPAATEDLLVVDDHGDVLRLDLATGAVVCNRPNESAEPAPWVWGVPAGAIRLESGLLISTASFGGGSWYVPDDPDEQVEPLWESFPVAVYWSTGAESVWLFENQNEVRLLNPIDMHTEPAIPLTGDGRPVAADGNGGLVILDGGEYSSLAADGTTTSLGNWSYLAAANPDTLVVLVCDPSPSVCRLVVVDRISGVERDLGAGPTAFSRGDLPEFVALSPAGTMLATPTLEGDLASVTPLDGPMVIDLETGSVVELTGGVWPGSTRDLVWSTDGSYLFWVDGQGGLRAWSPGDPDTVEQVGADVLPVLRNVAVVDRRPAGLG